MSSAYTMDATPRPFAQSNLRPTTSASAWSSSTASSAIIIRQRDQEIGVGFATDAASFLNGSWMKKKKPPAQRSRNAPPTSYSLARISESSSSLRRSLSSRETSSRPETSQTTKSYNIASQPSSPALPALRRLTPFASFTSLRSIGDSSEPTKKKRNNLLSFRITTPKTSSRSTSPEPPSTANWSIRSRHRSIEEADAHDRAMQQLPTDLSPTAAKLLGIEMRGSMVVEQKGGGKHRSGSGGKRGLSSITREYNSSSEQRSNNSPQTSPGIVSAATSGAGTDSSTSAIIKPFAHRQRPLQATPSMDSFDTRARSTVSSTPQSPLRESPPLSPGHISVELAKTSLSGSSHQPPASPLHSPPLSLQISRKPLPSSPQMSSPTSPQLSSRPSRQILSSGLQMSSDSSPQLSSRPSRQILSSSPHMSSTNSPQLSSRPSRQSILGKEDQMGQFYQQQLSARPSRQSMRSPSVSSVVSDSTLRAGTVSPINGKPRPEHPLEAEARIAKSIVNSVVNSVANSVNGSPIIANIDSYFQTPAQSVDPVQTTFYSDSSEGEGEEDEIITDGLRSSGNSLASSQTSYGIASPIDTDMNGRTDGMDHWALRPSTNAFRITATRLSPEDNAKGATSKHHQQSSTSSVGSFRSNSTASSAGAVRSFSRPFVRPTISSSDTAADLTDHRQASPGLNDRSLPNSIGLADGQPSMQLEAITENSPEVSDDETEPVKFDEKNHSRGHRRHASGSRNFSRPQLLESPTKPEADVESGFASRSIDNCPEFINGSNASPTMDKQVMRHPSSPSRRYARPTSLAFETARPLSLAFEKDSEVPLSAASAESVILRILESLDTFEDLFVAARLNKGFFTVFKKNELRLMKNTIRNMSPAQWELREASPKEIILGPGSGRSEYSPSNYVMFHKRDCLVVKGLKMRLLRSCQAQLRPDTIQALSDSSSDGAGRIEDAFWRIWTFCTIFGCDNRRYSSLEDQVEWFRGGEESRRHSRHDSRLSSNKSTKARTPSSQLTSDSFGKGNFGGLGLDELDDMLEIWDCLKDLLWGLTSPGCMAQAKTNGVIHSQRVVYGDRHAEQVVLEEWAHWLATQGLSVIADLAADTSARRTVAFSTAKNMDWTNWDAPAPGQTRGGFLREAIEHARDAKLAPQPFAKFSETMPIAERRKSRGHELAAQLREKERGFDLERASARDDKENFFDLWLAWTKKADAKVSSAPETRRPSRLPLSTTSPRTPPPQKPLPAIPVQTHQPPRSPPALPDPKINAVPNSARKIVRPRSSNNSLSLFPPQYRARVTPTGSVQGSPTSTPMRSRQNSISMESDSIELLKSRALKAARLSQSEKGLLGEGVFSPRLSVCPEG